MDGPLSAGSGAVHEHGGVGCVSLRYKTATLRYFVATAMLGRPPGRRPARGEEGAYKGRLLENQVI
jgi:hypothetical protein